MVRSYPDFWGSYGWIRIGEYTLTTGEHTIDIGHGEELLRLDKVVITDNPDFVPL